jgi:hypothetical protein
MHLLHNNYMTSTGNGPTWSVQINPPSRPVKSYYEETKIACEMIYAEKNGPLQLCLSGGLDSEYVLSVLLSLKMDVEVYIMKTKYNHDETKYAFKFCEQKNLTPKIIDLDFDKFIESGEMIEIAESINCCNFMIATNMWLIKQLGGTVITGNDPPHLKYNKSDNKWYLDEEEIIHSQLAFYRKYNISGTPYLLSYTPEQMLSFLIDPTIERLANNEYEGKLGTNSSKVFVFNNGTSFNLEQRKKLTGYELISDHPIISHPDIQTVFSWKSKYEGTSDHQYHEVVNKLKSGVPSVATAICPSNNI